MASYSIQILLYGVTTADTGDDITTASIIITDPTGATIYSQIKG